MKLNSKIAIAFLLCIFFIGGICVGNFLKKSIDLAKVTTGITMRLFPYEKVGHARQLLDNTIGEWKKFKNFERHEISKRLNYLVYNHCSNETPHTGLTNFNDLFENCRTACGGYVYVLRGLLDVFGIENRYVWLFNIPNQGNHSLVEAKIAPGQWSLFDPTFGVFFTEAGRIDELPLSMDKVQFFLRGKDLNNFVVQAKIGSLSDSTLPLVNIYRQGNFNHKYMTIDSYHKAEQYGYESKSLILPLSITLDLLKGKSKFGIFGNDDLQAAERKFLSIANATLLDDDPGNDVSFALSYLGRGVREFNSILILINLETGKNYLLSLSLYNSNSKAAKFQVAQFGGKAIFESNSPISVRPGSVVKKLQFKANSPEAIFIVRPLTNENSMIRLFGIEVHKLL